MVLEDDNYFTIRQIVEITGLTRQAIEYRINKLGISNIMGLSGVRLYTRHQVFMIKNNCLASEFYPIESEYVRETYCIIPSKLNFMF